MILFVTNSFTATVDWLCDFCKLIKQDFFRFNVDYWEKYKFCIDENGFKIIDILGRRCDSKFVEYVVTYKGALSIGQYNNSLGYDSNWIASTINNVVNNLIVRSCRDNKLKLFTPVELLFPKTLQMHNAKLYWRVPTWSMEWGHEIPNKSVMVKQLTQRSYKGKCLDVQKVNAADLSPEFPWFIQEPAKGNRDATVLYINGKVHCFQFATERGELTDWRVTQGTAANKWKPWNAGKEFEDKVRAYMHDMGLKFGRLDFIIGGDEPEFLEVNPCGQFGWLDDENLTLHREVLEAIMDPSSTIEL